MTPSQIKVGDGEAPDPQKEKEEKERAQKGAEVAGQQAPPSKERGEASKEL